MAAVVETGITTKTKQVNNSNKKNKLSNPIEIVSKNKYEQLERKYKRLVLSQDKTIQRVEDLALAGHM